jgi:hypothetical protein
LAATTSRGGTIGATDQAAQETIRDLAKAEFATLHLRLLTIVDRVAATRHRVRNAFAADFPEFDLVPGLAATLLSRRI